jgi:uncharacterized protein (DUF433 family)
MSTQLDTLLVRTPGTCGGRLRIDGTRITVNQIVTMYKRGETPEEIAAHYPHLGLGQIYAALAYYLANCDEIEADLTTELAEAEQLREQHAGIIVCVRQQYSVGEQIRRLCALLNSLTAGEFRNRLKFL